MQHQLTNGNYYRFWKRQRSDYFDYKINFGPNETHRTYYFSLIKNPKPETKSFFLKDELKKCGKVKPGLHLTLEVSMLYN